MSSEKTLPSVDLMSCQHGGEVIPSIAIERIISLRNEGIRVYLDGIDKLRKARDLMQQAGGSKVTFEQLLTLIRQQTQYRATINQKPGELQLLYLTPSKKGSFLRGTRP